MSYFGKIDDYQTYSGQDSEFHYDFNANSGGGQAFLAGKIIDMSGKQATPSELEGSSASFSLNVRGQLVSLLSNGDGCYAISPRGVGSQSMRLGIQAKINPNSLMAAALMLPGTCGRNMAISINVSPLTTNNYWLRSMWLDIDRHDVGTAIFVPKDFVFEGGLSKRNGVAAEKGVITGRQQFFKLDYVRRVEDIITLADDATLPDYARNVLGFYRAIYLGNTNFEYEECVSAVENLMRELSFEYCDTYSGYSDPLAFLMELRCRKAGASRCVHVSKDINKPHNLIYFGAPGTGKSYQLNEIAIGNEEVSKAGLFDKKKVRRVTFHPDYTYSQFVGCYRPFSDENGEIGYKYIAGPFLETYLDAIAHPDESYLLLIEELNRANPAAVFGDVFQLLDRNDVGRSEYSVNVPEDMAKCMKDYFGRLSTNERTYLDNYYDDLGFDGFFELSLETLALPSNMFIWATMNSADQGVYPMDTAFKRRWDFHYIGIDDEEDAIKGKVVPLGKTGRLVLWNDLRHAINGILKGKVNEDKLLGPFFIAPSVLDDRKRFNDVFKSKVLLYLYEDAAKTKRRDVFKNGADITYSKLCEIYDREGEGAFADGFQKLSDRESVGSDTANDGNDSDEFDG